MVSKQSKPYPVCNRNRMCFNRWSRHEPVLFTKTDHWSKQRAKAYQLTQLPTGKVISFYAPQELFSARRLGLPNSTGITEQGTLAPVGDKQFSKFLKRELHSGSIVRPHVPPDSRGYDKKVRPPSAYSERAKSGFVYWCREPQTIKYGNKRTFGSFKTVFGIGDAPRK